MAPGAAPQGGSFERIRPAEITRDIETNPDLVIDGHGRIFVACVEFLIGLIATACPRPTTKTPGSRDGKTRRRPRRCRRPLRRLRTRSISTAPPPGSFRISTNCRASPTAPRHC